MQQTYPCYSSRWKVVIMQVLYSKKIIVLFELKECGVSKKKKKKEKKLGREKYYYVVLFCTAVILNAVNIELLKRK